MKKTLEVIRQYFRLVFPFLLKDWRSVISSIFTAFLTIVDAVAVPLTPWFFGELLKPYFKGEGHKMYVLPSFLRKIGNYLPISFEEHAQYASVLVILLVICWFLSKTIKRLRSMVFFYVINDAIRTIRLRLVTHFHRASLQSGQIYDPEEVLSASTRVSMSLRFCLRKAFLSFMPTVFQFMVTILMMYCVWGGSIFFVLAILLTYVYVFFAIRRFVKVRHAMWNTSDEVMVAMGDSMRQGSFARLHPLEEKQRLEKIFDRESKGWWHENIVNHQIHLIQNALFFLIAGVFFFCLVKLMQKEHLEAVKVLKLKGYIFLMYRQVFSLTEYVRGASAYIVDMKKVLDLLSMETDDKERESKEDVVFSAEVPIFKFEKVAFSYPKEKGKVLENLFLEVRHGDQIGIQGASGSGKSTLASLMAGLYLPTQGEVMFRGVSMQHLSPAVMGRYLYFIGQDDPLVGGSIRDNLWMTDPKDGLLSLNYLKDIIDDPKRSKRLSGGERQRVLLARCLSYGPKVVLLDEAFSYLDDDSALSLLHMVLEKVPTVILMTHRKTLLKAMHMVYDLGGGQLKKSPRSTIPRDIETN